MVVTAKIKNKTMINAFIGTSPLRDKISKNLKRSSFTILTAALIISGFFIFSATPVRAELANGDVTIVVQNQAGTPIEDATATLLFYGGGKGGYSMPGKPTDGIGTAIFTAAEIAVWLAAEGYNPEGQIYAQPGAKVETDTAYVKVRTVDPGDGFPCIPYNTPGGA
ncbi:MAG: hypothetical protein E3J36_00955, partial [Candidatus Nealsonbacteria bacterium]